MPLATALEISGFDTLFGRQRGRFANAFDEDIEEKACNSFWILFDSLAPETSDHTDYEMCKSFRKHILHLAGAQAPSVEQVQQAAQDTKGMNINPWSTFMALLRLTLVENIRHDFAPFLNLSEIHPDELTSGLGQSITSYLNNWIAYPVYVPMNRKKLEILSSTLAVF